MKRIFLCAERFFPRGDAGANRVLYIAKALQNQGWNVIVLSIGKNDENSFNGTGYFYEGIQYENIVCNTNGKIQKVERLLFNGNKTVALLKKHGLTNMDKVYIYSSTAPYTSAVLQYAKKCGAPVAVDVVEWHQPFQFRYGKIDPRYKSFMKCFNKLFVEAGNVIAISNLLKQHFKENGCNVLKMPIFIEPKDSYVYEPMKNRLNLIYPGNPYRKDSLETMLDALELLSEEEQSRVCLHLTGVTRHMLEQSVPGKEHLLDMNCVQIHGWMKYKDLMELYKSIDFALIARPDNTVTWANFPSKVPELMNRGIPVIITPVGDIREYLKEDRDSIFIGDFTGEACAKAIRKCLSKEKSEKEEMHKTAFESARMTFDYRKSEMQLNQFFINIK